MVHIHMYTGKAKGLWQNWLWFEHSTTAGVVTRKKDAVGLWEKPDQATASH